MVVNQVRSARCEFIIFDVIAVLSSDIGQCAVLVHFAQLGHVNRFVRQRPCQRRGDAENKEVRIVDDGYDLIVDWTNGIAV